VSMRIQFNLGSFELRPDDEKKMANLATALADDRLKTQSFAVIGHTDASGPLALNMRLSSQRAIAARDFLVKRGVDPSRLIAQGKGPVDPLVTDDPNSPLNRRVEVALLPR
jgi:outer membrane protein OmpA-like peptidoglycan-associated protein